MNSAANGMALVGASLGIYVALALLVVAVLVPKVSWMWAFFCAAGCIGSATSLLVYGQGVVAALCAVIGAVAALRVLRKHGPGWRARFTRAETRMITAHFPDLSRGEARKLLDAGEWISLFADTELAQQGAAVTHLYYIAEGGASVRHGQTAVATCLPGSFVGEVTAAAGGPATANVITTQEAIVWKMEAEIVRALLSKGDDTARALEMAFARSLRAKLGQMNSLVAAYA